MLSLDLGGAYDNVSHERLLAILHTIGFPPWTIQFTKSFLTERRTRIAYAGHVSVWLPTQTGIPQGSPISPILFLLLHKRAAREFPRHVKRNSSDRIRG